MSPTPYFALRRTSSAPAELITLAEAKLYLRVDHTEEDLLISEMIVAVRCHAEEMIGRALVEQSWQVDYLQSLPCDITLPMRPVRSVTLIQTRDESGAVVTVPASAYRLLNTSLLHVDTPLCGPLISIAYDAGNAAAPDHDMRQAMLMHLAMCYDMRGTDAPIPAAIQTYETYREIRV